MGSLAELCSKEIQEYVNEPKTIRAFIHDGLGFYGIGDYANFCREHIEDENLLFYFDEVRGNYCSIESGRSVFLRSVLGKMSLEDILNLVDRVVYDNFPFTKNVVVMTCEFLKNRIVNPPVYVHKDITEMKHVLEFVNVANSIIRDTAEVAYANCLEDLLEKQLTKEM